MRYLYYIIGMLAILTAVVGYQLRSPRVADQHAALVINDRTFTDEEINALQGAQRPPAGGRREFINALITRELLIQESQRQGIDREEPFRRSIQNFYEQSLIKLLMDRKFSSLTIPVDEAQVTRYLALGGKRVRLTLFRVTSAAEAAAPLTGGEASTACFDDLSKEMRDAVARLRDGESAPPIKMDDGYLVVRCDRTEDATDCGRHSIDREAVRRALTEEKKEKMISDWIAELRKNASIQIRSNETK